MKWIILAAGIGCNAIASVLIKIAITPPRKFPNIMDPVASLMNWPFWLGLALYCGALLFYAASLTRLPLNIAHPVMTSGAVATVAVLSWVMFKEEFGWSTILGICLVIAGMVLISARAV